VQAKDNGSPQKTSTNGKISINVRKNNACPTFGGNPTGQYSGNVDENKLAGTTVVSNVRATDTDGAVSILLFF
jgi:hypothetical protein